jgi:hypothetical protein
VFKIFKLHDADEDDEEEFTDSDDHEDNPFVEDRSLGYVIWLFGPTKALLLLPLLSVKVYPIKLVYWYSIVSFHSRLKTSSVFNF